MTEGPDEGTPQGSPQGGDSAKPPIKPRRVAKTKMYQTGSDPGAAAESAAHAASSQEPLDGSSADNTTQATANIESSASAPAEPISPAPSVPAAQKPRRVAKTQMYPLAGETFASISKASEPGRKIRKTLLYEVTEASAQSEADFNQLVVDASTIDTPEVRTGEAGEETAAVSNEAASPSVHRPTVGRQPAEMPVRTSARRGSRAFVVAKTKLDMDVLAVAVSKYEAKKQEKAMAEAAERANEPVKEFIPVDSKKLATPCAWTWNEADSRENFRYCGKCNAAVYNFEGMEWPEAEALIFKRESKNKPTLFKRADGKFMTTDCPLELKRQNDRLMLALVAAALLIGAIVVIRLMPPPPPRPVRVPDPIKTEAPGANITGAYKTVPGTGRTVQRKDGTFHWEEGQPVPPKSATPQPVQAVPTNTYKAPDPDETGGFWQYSSGQPGGAPVQTAPNR